MVGCTISFRPFGYFTRAFFVKHYVFENRHFVKKIPWYKKGYPFEIGFYVIPEEYMCFKAADCLGDISLD